MRVIRSMMLGMLAVAVLFSVAMAQAPAGAQRGGGGAAGGQQRGAADARGGDARGGAQRGGGGRGGAGGAAILSVTSTAWPDGGTIPLRYTQVGGETSPGVQWSGAPQGIMSYVITFQDADSVAQNSTDGLLHWMVWNIPANMTNLPPGQPDGFQLDNGISQISVSGSRYRGPGAPAAGPVHHYVLEVYALDTMIDVKVPPQGPQDPNPNVQQIRGQIMQAMVGHIRGKGSYVGLFHRPQ
jgi:Raf kinase inhibitor-like YbhB/YbcL family protein